MRLKYKENKRVRPLIKRKKCKMSETNRYKKWRKLKGTKKVSQ